MKPKKVLMIGLGVGLAIFTGLSPCLYSEEITLHRVLPNSPPVYFVGFLTVEGTPRFGLVDAQGLNMGWCTLGQTFRDYRLVSYDANGGRLTLEAPHKPSLQLTLQAGPVGNVAQLTESNQQAIARLYAQHTLPLPTKQLWDSLLSVDKESVYLQLLNSGWHAYYKETESELTFKLVHLTERTKDNQPLILNWM